MSAASAPLAFAASDIEFGRKVYESLPYTTDDVGTSFAYDALDRLQQATSTDSSRVRYEYPNGVDVRITDQEDRITTQDWAAFGNPGDKRLVSVTDAENQSWSYLYNHQTKVLVRGQGLQGDENTAPRGWPLRCGPIIGERAGVGLAEDATRAPD